MLDKTIDHGKPEPRAGGAIRTLREKRLKGSLLRPLIHPGTIVTHLYDRIEGIVLSDGQSYFSPGFNGLIAIEAQVQNGVL